MGSGDSPAMSLLTLFSSARTSKLGIEEDQPVPIPDAPFTSVIGKIGAYLVMK